MSIFNKKKYKKTETNELENILIEMTSQLKSLREDVGKLQSFLPIRNRQTKTQSMS